MGSPSVLSSHLRSAVVLSSGSRRSSYRPSRVNTTSTSTITKSCQCQSAPTKRARRSLGGTIQGKENVLESVSGCLTLFRLNADTSSAISTSTAPSHAPTTTKSSMLLSPTHTHSAATPTAAEVAASPASKSPLTKAPPGASQKSSTLKTSSATSPTMTPSTAKSISPPTTFASAGPSGSSPCRSKS